MKKIKHHLILTSIIILLTISLTVAATLMAFNSKANLNASINEGFTNETTDAEFISNEILIKIKKADEARVKSKPIPADTGLASLNKLNKTLRVTKIQKIVNVTKMTKNKDHEVFRWFKITLPGNRELIKEESLLTTQGPAATSSPKARKVKAALAKYKKDPNIEVAQLNYVFRTTGLPNDTYVDPDQDGTWSTGAWGQPYEDLWGLKKIKVEQAWNSNQGEGVIVAVVDTGLDYNHNDISGNVWTNPGEIAGNGLDDDGNGFVDDVYGWNFVHGNNDPLDLSGHGTHVAGTIAAVGNNNRGIIGVAPKAKIMAVKGLNDNGFGLADWLSNAIRYAADNGAKVINNSWGCGFCPSAPIVEDAVRYAHDVHGSVVVFAAGNTTIPPNNVIVSSPQNLPETIIVSAFDQNDNKASFSRFGQLIDVAAPGGESGFNCSEFSYQNILSLRAKDTDVYAECGPDWVNQMVVGTDYYRLRGTSMAAPHVAGLAALILSKHPEFTNEEVRQVIRLSADDVDALGFDVNSGRGRINAASALSINSVLTVEFKQPRPLTNLHNLETLDIQGTAKGPVFASYNLSYGVGLGPTKWVTIIDSTSPVDNQTLGTWDIGSLESNWYTLRLMAIDNQNQLYDTYLTLFKENVNPLITSAGRFSFPKPVVSEDKVVWLDIRNGYQDIFLYDIKSKTELQITNDPTVQENPDIDGNRIVWQDGRNGNSDIYFYDLATGVERQITNDPTSQVNPAISGNKIVWEDLRSGVPDIYLYDLSTNKEGQITNNFYRQTLPAISGDRIVWVDSRNGGDIYLYDLILNREKQLTHNQSSQSMPAVSDNKVVWMDRRNGNSDIYLYDLATDTEQRITTNPKSQFSPVVFGEHISWVDDRNGNFDIFINNLITGEEHPIALDLTDQLRPSIYGRNVIWLDRREGKWDIYIKDLPNLAPVVQILDPDVDDDGLVAMTDINLVVGAFASQISTYDLNGDGFVTATDIFHVVGAFGLFWPPTNLPEGRLLNFYVRGVDPERKGLAYSADGLPPGSCFNGRNSDGTTGLCRAGQFLWTPSSTQSGSYQVTFIVNDGSQSSSKTLPIIVLNTK